MPAILQKDEGTAPGTAGRSHTKRIYSTWMWSTSYEEKKERVKSIGYQWHIKAAKTGVTRTVKEMEKRAISRNMRLRRDGRITYVFITEKVRSYRIKYDKIITAGFLKYMDHISEEEADCMISTIEKFYKVMSERRVDIE